MKCYFNCVAAAVAVIALHLCATTVADAQTYQDILKQVASPGFGAAGNRNSAPAASDLPTMDSVFQQEAPAAPAAPASRVPSTILNNGPQPKAITGSGGQATGEGKMVTNYQYMGSGQDCNAAPIINNGPVVGAPCTAMTTATDVNCGGQATAVQPSNIYSPAYTAPVDVPGQALGSANPVVTAPNCGSAPAANAMGGYVGNSAKSGSNLVFSVFGLVFDRDYEDDVSLVCNDVGEVLRSTDADVGNLGGFEFSLGRRNSDGNGIDLRYWGLFTNEASYDLTGGSFTSHIPALSNVTWPGNGRTIVDVINGSTLNNISTLR